MTIKIIDAIKVANGIWLAAVTFVSATTTLSDRANLEKQSKDLAENIQKVSSKANDLLQKNEEQEAKLNFLVETSKGLPESLKSAIDRIENLDKNKLSPTEVDTDSIRISLDEGNRIAEKILDEINKLSTSGSSSSATSFSGNLTDFYSKWMDFLQDLPVEKVIAIAHLISLFILVNSLFNVFIIFYSDYLIKSYSLESKYPRLSKWIALRRKIQIYGIYFHSFISAIVIIMTLSFNLFILFL